MTISYHSGERIQGLSTDETTITPTGYKIHKITSDTDFVITSGSGDIEVLLVAGGGGGGGETAGGGGAGGLLYQASRAMTSGTYPVNIGDGGVGSYHRDNPTSTNDGGNSTFNGATANGGGAGGGQTRSGRSGGSGGGGGQGGGAGSATQGNSSSMTGYGSNGNSASDGGSAGGGSHAMGGNSNSLNGAVGGEGKGGTNNSAINSLLIDASAGHQDGSTGYYYVAGGGSGAKDHSQERSKGGGGESGNGAGAIAITSTGSGGGGGIGSGATGGTGADGICIIKYLSSEITATGGTVYTPSTTTTGVKPTNVPTYSRFEETDTRKMYSLRPTSVTLTDDFSSSSGYTFGTGNSISGGVLTCRPASTSLGFTKALGFTLDNDKWVMRIHGWEVQSGYSWSSAMVYMFGFSDQSGLVAYNGSGNNFGFQIFNRSAGGMINNVRSKLNGTGGTGGNSSVGEGGTNLVVGTKYYIECKRTSATSGELRIYSDSDFTTLHSTAYISDTTMSAATGLDYFSLQAQTVGGTHVVNIDKIVVYNGVTEADEGGWKEKGTT